MNLMLQIISFPIKAIHVKVQSKILYMVFIDLNKAFNRLPRQFKIGGALKKKKRHPVASIRTVCKMMHEFPFNVG